MPWPAHLRCRTAVVLAAAALACAAALGAAPAHAVVIGLSDQSPRSFDDPRFQAMPLDHVRLVVPWDVAFSDGAEVAAWLGAAAARGLVPMVAFEHAAADRCPDAPCVLPSMADLRAAYEAFQLRWPEVTEWTPWNEPNHPSQPTAGYPEAAAARFELARSVCPACTLVAGDVVDNSTMRSWVRSYRGALHAEPPVWGIHNYGDATYPRATMTSWLVGLVPGQVWITETGGIVRFTAADGADQLPYDEARAAASIDRAFAIAASSPRITRMYLYNWHTGPWERFDAALTTFDGTARPSLQRLLAHVGTRPGVPAPVLTLPDGSSAPAPTTPAGGAANPSRTPSTSGPARATDHGAAGGSGSVEATAAGTISIAHGLRPPSLRDLHAVRGGLRVLVRCPGRATCRGQLLAYLRPHGGKPRPLGGRALRSGGWVTIHAPRSTLAPLLRSRRGRIQVAVVLRDPVAATTASWLARQVARRAGS